MVDLILPTFKIYVGEVQGTGYNVTILNPESFDAYLRKLFIISLHLIGTEMASPVPKYCGVLVSNKSQYLYDEPLSKIAGANALDAKAAYDRINAAVGLPNPYRWVGPVSVLHKMSCLWKAYPKYLSEAKSTDFSCCPETTAWSLWAKNQHITFEKELK